MRDNNRSIVTSTDLAQTDVSPCCGAFIGEYMTECPDCKAPIQG